MIVVRHSVVVDEPVERAGFHALRELRSDKMIERVRRRG